jgi:hypothetical protein
MRRVHDLELLLNRLALVQPAVLAETVPGSGVVARQNLLTFVPEGARGVAAYVDGQKAASA